MKRTRVESNFERQLLTAMIVSKPFLASLTPQLDTGLFQTQYVQQIAAWCKDYFKQYDDAPGKAIQSMYHAWVENEKPLETDVDAVHDFLETLSGEYDSAGTVNVPHLLDEAAKYLTLKRIGKLNDSLTYDLTFGKSGEALEAIQQFRGVELNGTAGYDPIRSKDAMTRAFAEPLEPIIEFPGSAGDFFRRALTRDTLVGIEGPEKRGKTYWCLEFVYRAIKARRKVAMFEVGDLSEGQLSRRMAVRMAGIPMWQEQCADVKLPRKITLRDVEGGREAKVKFDHVSFTAPIDFRLARRGQKRFRRTHKLPNDESFVMFSAHPMYSINVHGINGILKRWQYEQAFVPDVIIIDYADILAPESNKEYRHQVNETWMALRRLSQEWHACVIVPTQASALSYDAKLLSMKHVSENKLKHAHVTAMLGLNQTEEEKEQQVMRLNWILLRESPYQTKQCLWVAQCIPLGMSFVRGVK